MKEVVRKKRKYNSMALLEYFDQKKEAGKASQNEQLGRESINLREQESEEKFWGKIEGMSLRKKTSLRKEREIRAKKYIKKC